MKINKRNSLKLLIIKLMATDMIYNSTESLINNKI